MEKSDILWTISNNNGDATYTTLEIANGEKVSFYNIFPSRKDARAIRNKLSLKDKVGTKVVKIVC